MNDQLKPLHWIGSSLKDLKALSDSLRDVFGYALHLAQEGKKHPQTKPLRGFGAETPMPDISLINARLKTAEEHHKESNS